MPLHRNAKTASPNPPAASHYQASQLSPKKTLIWRSPRNDDGKRMVRGNWRVRRQDLFLKWLLNVNREKLPGKHAIVTQDRRGRVEKTLKPQLRVFDPSRASHATRWNIWMRTSRISCLFIGQPRNQVCMRPRQVIAPSRFSYFFRCSRALSHSHYLRCHRRLEWCHQRI